MTMARINRAAFLFVLAAGLSACRRERPAGPAPSAALAGPRIPRDVVLITIDTLRYDAVGFDGNPRGTTPNLDRFAAEGRVFDQAHAHNTITLPSHTNILTGMLPYQHGVRENAGFRLSPKTPTMATRLKAKGYTTGAFVGAYVLDSRYGLNHDFDVYDELYRHLDEQLEFKIQQARAEDVVKAAVDWYRSQEGKQRFLWMHVYDPHAPYDPPKDYKERFSDNLYFGEVAYTDASIAPLLDVLRNVHPAPFVVVTGDHGEGFGDHGELTHGLFCYEATLHIPLIVWCPDLVPPGRNGVWARHIDIVPTMLDALGLPKPPELTGQSLLPAGRGEAPEGSYFEALSAAFNRGWAPLRGIESHGVKYIDLPIQELYELPTDPKEEKNLAAGTPDSLRRLRKRLLDLPAAPHERGMIGSEEAAKLRSLGYLTGSAELKTTYGPADDPKTLIKVDQTIHIFTGLMQEEKFDEAVVVSRRVVRENPHMKIGYQNLASALVAKKDVPGAIRVMEQATANGAGGETMDRRRGLLLSEIGRSAEAVKVLMQYQESEDPESLNALGIVLSDAGRPAEALPVFARAIELDPSGADGYQNTGIALLKLNRPTEARDNLEMALRFGKRHTKAWNALGVAYQQLGNDAKAIHAWEECVALNPEQYDALYNIGRVAGQMHDWKKARAALEKFVATAPPKQYGKDIGEIRAVLSDMKRQGI